MPTGYTRTDTVNNISDGNIIRAEDFDLEYDAIQAAFSAGTGHNHDGTIGGGAPIISTGPAQDFVFTGARLEPKTDNFYDLGSLTKRFKDIYGNTLSMSNASNFRISLSQTGATADRIVTFGNFSGEVVINTATQTLSNKTITNSSASGLVLNDGYTEEVYVVSGTAPALSPADGSIQTWTLSGNSTPTAGAWASGQSMTLMIDDGASFSITWTSLAVSWKTDGGGSPILNTTGFTVVSLWKVGSVIYGARVGDA